MKTPRSKKWKACFKLASRHRKSHAGFDRALHACLARSFGDSQEVHSDRAKSTLREVRRLLKRARVYLSTPPDCKNAASLIMTLNQMRGAYLIDRSARSSRAGFGGKGPALITKKFIDLCVVKPKSAAAERKMRAVWR